MYILVFESSRYIAVRFAIRHFLGGFLDGKMTASLNG